MAKWQGTPVPNSGHVDKVYFNTSLSVDEVVNIIESANLTFTNDEMVILLATQEMTMGLTIQKYNNEYSIYDVFTGIFYFSSKIDSVAGTEFIGWNSEITYPIAVNGNALNELEGESVGAENDKLIDLFSTTPFVEVQEKVTLNSFLTGIADAIRSKKGTTDKINASNFASEIASISGGGGASAVIKTLPSWQGTAVPNNGYVENVYFNTSLSVDEVTSIFNKLTFTIDPSQDGIEIWSCFTDDTMSNVIAINHWIEEDYYRIYWLYGDSGNVKCVFTTESTLDYFGWNPNFNGIATFNMDNMLSSIGPSLGFTLENEKAANLFSITPFVQASGESIGLSGEYDGSSIEVSEAGKVDIKALIENKKIPLEINVNVKGGSGVETLIVLKYMIETVNMILDASKVVFNNPDNIPIYKSVMTILDYETGEIAFGDLELYEGELTFWNEGNIIESNTIDETNGSVTYYFIKPKDLIGKQCPYITGITLTIDNENLTTTCAILPNNFSVVEIGGILLIDNSGRSYIYEAGTYSTTNHKIELSNHIMIKS